MLVSTVWHFYILLKGSNGSIEDQANHLPLKLQAGMTLAYVVIFIISLVGNLMMVYVIFKKPHLRKTTNLLLANMAIADLVITFFAMPYSVVFLYLRNVWISGIFGDVTCKIIQYALALSISASILTHALVSLDRFFSILFPFKRVTFIKNPRLSYSFIWCTSCLLMSPYFVVYGVKNIGPDGPSYCVVKEEYFKFLQVFFALVFLLLYVVPLVFIGTLYAFICQKLWRNNAPGSRSRMAILKREAQNKKTVKMLIILVMSFAFCWLPAHIMHLLILFWSDIAVPVVATLLSFWACHSHSAINPILVTSLNGLYRKACCEVIWNLRKTRRMNNNAPGRKLLINDRFNNSMKLRESPV